MRFRRPSDDPLLKKAKRGFRGDPILTVSYYGPDDVRATKVSVGLQRTKGETPEILERIFSQERDVRQDPIIRQRVLEHYRASGAKSVALAQSILGCPHEEGVDYAEGTECPQCPFWSGRDRFAATRAEMLARSLAASLFESQRVPVDPDREVEDEDELDIDGPGA